MIEKMPKVAKTEVVDKEVRTLPALLKLAKSKAGADACGPSNNDRLIRLVA